MSKIHRQKRREYFRMQKLIGLAMVLFALCATWLGVAIGVSECGAILLVIPWGLYLILTKEMVLDFGYKLELERKQRAH